MNYVGIDPVVGLECSDCKHVSKIAYSRLLDRVVDEGPVFCDNCGRTMAHDWSTVKVVQDIIRRRMQQQHRAKSGRSAVQQR